MTCISLYERNTLILNYNHHVPSVCAINTAVRTHVHLIFIDKEDFQSALSVPWFWFRVPCFADDDECVSDPCLNGGFCLDDINDYFCVCAPGWNGKDCENGESSVALENCHSLIWVIVHLKSIYVLRVLQLVPEVCNRKKSQFLHTFVSFLCFQN